MSRLALVKHDTRDELQEARDALRLALEHLDQWPVLAGDVERAWSTAQLATRHLETTAASMRRAKSSAQRPSNPPSRPAETTRLTSWRPMRSRERLQDLVNGEGPPPFPPGAVPDRSA